MSVIEFSFTDVSFFFTNFRSYCLTPSATCLNHEIRNGAWDKLFIITRHTSIFSFFETMRNEEIIPLHSRCLHKQNIFVYLELNATDFRSTDTGRVRRLKSNGATGRARHLASAFCAKALRLVLRRHSSMNSFGAARSLGTMRMMETGMRATVRTSTAM